ncbi:MAG: acetylglutamate kinase [Phycisphaerae bacterium]
MEQAIHKAAGLIEALGYIQRFHEKIVVVKMGGSLMDDAKAIDTVLTDLVFMASVGILPIVVHGGGKEITEALTTAGLETRFVQGRRYTDQRTLSIAEHILCNQVNKRLVDTLNQQGAQAVGMHSLSSCVLLGERMFLDGEEGRRIDIGYVGKITQVNAYLLKVLCHAETIPVIAPIALDKGGNKLNVNADDVAGEVAAAVHAEKLVVLSDTHGIRLDPNDPNSLASELSESQIMDLIKSGVITGGMLPKVNACLRALEGGVKKTHIIDGRINHSLMLEIYTDKGVGTQIIK